MNLPQYITGITFVNWKEKEQNAIRFDTVEWIFKFFSSLFHLWCYVVPKDFTLKLTGLHYHVTLRFDRAGRDGRKGRSLLFFTQNPSGSLSRAEFMITMMQRCHSHGSLLRFAIWASQRVSSSIRQRPRRSARMPRARWLDVYNSSHRCRLKLWNVVMHAWVLVVNMPSWRKNFHSTFMLLFFFVNPLHPAQLVRPENVP